MIKEKKSIDLRGLWEPLERRYLGEAGGGEKGLQFFFT